MGIAWGGHCEGLGGHVDAASCAPQVNAHNILIEMTEGGQAEEDSRAGRGGLKIGDLVVAIDSQVHSLSADRAPQLPLA